MTIFFLSSRLRDLPSYGRTLSGLYPLGLLSIVRIIIGLMLLLQHRPYLSALYKVLVHRDNLLPPASFRFHLAVDTLAFGCNLPTIRAVWGLAPVRVRSCWANNRRPHFATTAAWGHDIQNPNCQRQDFTHTFRQNKIKCIKPYQNRKRLTDALKDAFLVSCKSPKN